MIGSQTIHASDREPFSFGSFIKQLIIWFISAHALLIAGSLMGLPRPLMKHVMVAIFLLNGVYIAFQAIAYESSVWKSNVSMLMLVATGVAIFWSLEHTAWGDPERTEAQLKTFVESIPGLPVSARYASRGAADLLDQLPYGSYVSRRLVSQPAETSQPVPVPTRLSRRSRSAAPLRGGRRPGNASAGLAVETRQEPAPPVSLPTLEVVANGPMGDGWRVTLKNNGDDAVCNIQYEVLYFSSDGEPIGPDGGLHLLESTIGPQEAQTVQMDEHLVPPEASYASVNIVSWEVIEASPVQP